MSCVRVPVGVRSRSARVLASCVVLSVTAGCAVDVTEYTPFATSTKPSATASAASPTHTGSTRRVEQVPVPAYSAPSSQSRSGSVTVRRGDTLYGLSRRHNVSVRQLIAANHLARPYTIRPGQTLVLPSANPTPAGAPLRRTVAASSGSVRVATGDTVYGIARRYNISAGRLIAANRLNAPYAIHPGQSLRLPSGASNLGRYSETPVYTASTSTSRSTGASSVRVARGDTLYSIARRHRVPVRQLIAINRIPAPFHVHTGQVLSLSWRSASVTPQVRPVAASPKTSFDSRKTLPSVAAGSNLSADRTTGVPALEPVDGERQPVSAGNRYKVPAKTARAYNKVVNKHGIIPGQTVLVPF